MNLIKSSLVFFVFIILLSAVSCTKDEENIVKGAFSSGLFIVNEGAFQTGTGTITYFNPDSSLIKQDIFELINGRPLGNIAQSLTLFNGKGYIVINNAAKVEVVDAATFKSSGTITGLQYPSQFLPINDNKAYVSDWSGSIAVVDLQTNTVLTNISAGTGPDAMVKSGNYVYVANTGGFNVDSTITVIDFATDKVVKTIEVGDVPIGIKADNQGRIWVLCKGKGYASWPAPGDTPGRLVRIDPATLTIGLTFLFLNTTDHPERLVINKQKTKLYFLYNSGIYFFDLTKTYPVPELLTNTRYFYSLGYENKTGYLYACDAKDFSHDGVVIRYNSEDGSVVDSIQAGIIPREFAFPE